MSSMMSNAVTMQVFTELSRSVSMLAAAAIDRARIELMRASIGAAADAWEVARTLPPDVPERQTCEAIRRHGLSLGATLLASFSQTSTAGLSKQ